MDPISFDGLVDQKKIIELVDIDLQKDYFILGHYDFRRSEFRGTSYPQYAVRAIDVLGPNLKNADRQLANSNLTFSTTSSVYIDVPNMVVTTIELGSPTPGALGNYQIHFNCSYALSDDLSSAQFILNINGVDIAATEVIEDPNTVGIQRTTLIWQADALPAGSLIKIRFKITPGNLGSSVSVYNRTLMIDGINNLVIV